MALHSGSDHSGEIFLTFTIVSEFNSAFIQG